MFWRCRVVRNSLRWGHVLSFGSVVRWFCGFVAMDWVVYGRNCLGYAQQLGCVPWFEELLVLFRRLRMPCTTQMLKSSDLCKLLKVSARRERTFEYLENFLDVLYSHYLHVLGTSAFLLLLSSQVSVRWVDLLPPFFTKKPRSGLSHLYTEHRDTPERS